MNRILTAADRVFDRLSICWESHINRRFIGFLLVAVYLLALLAIEMANRNLLPGFLARLFAGSHFYAISIAFTLLLYIEVIDLVFGLTRSVSEAVGKQFEIFSLILLRQAFKEFSGFSEPLQWQEVAGSVLHILANAGGALVIFIVLLIFYRHLRHHPITDDSEDRFGFIAAKKMLSLLLLLIFNACGVYFALTWVQTGETGHFFPVFFTILIFSDILIALVSLRYSASFPVVFRNSGFALATVVIRMALTAPPYFNAALGISAGVYVLVLNIFYNYYAVLQTGGTPAAGQN